MTTDDQAAVTARVEPHRRELQVHCYRMLGSYEDFEDLLQETFLRAWRKRDTYAGRPTLHAWLYRIATNGCLEALERKPRIPAPHGELPWLQLFPDALLCRARRSPTPSSSRARRSSSPTSWRSSTSRRASAPC